MNYECKYLYAIIRKPQEGKTFICINNIKQNPNTIHIIFTMNTIKSNNQFFERASQEFKDKLIILNSHKKTDSSHFNNVLEVIDNFTDNKKEILIMCCHQVRFCESIQKIIKFFKKMNIDKSIIIHIDEAHEYIPKYRKELYEINNENIIERVYLYSATPFKFWEKHDHLIYQKIYVVDICEQFKIRESEKYFGVKDAQLICIKKPKEKEFEDIVDLNKTIPNFIIERWDPRLQEKNLGNLWYTKNRTYFDLGKEYEFLCFLEYAFSKCIQKKFIQNNEFSYNFFPAYTRRVTHFGIMNIILKKLSNALVIVFNGIVSNAYINNNKGGIIEIKLENENEPSKQIENIIKKYPNRPIFITGHICVGMSVTLINHNIGNFDNVLFSFPQYFKQHDVLYQMCRFLFNYIGWPIEKQDKIKKTRFITDNLENYTICLKYEQQIDKINKEMTGSLRTLDEVKGTIRVKQSKIPIEKKNEKLNKYIKSGTKIFKVYEGNERSEKEIWDNVEKWWRWKKGKDITKKSRPKKNNQGFMECSTTHKPKVFQLTELKSGLNKLKWYSNYQLVENTYNYLRLYVGYDSLEHNTEYTIFIRWLVIDRNDIVSTFLKENYAKK